ncbi:MAG: zinc ABC transporter substrate-binding protein [Fibrobacteres bacterium]|nr:zinc ABC transporter substrate-binding protein [Fibrobacterota bacterium]
MKSILLLLMMAIFSVAKINIVTSITDLASIAAAVGGARVEVIAIARPDANPHSVEVFPSYMAKVSRAALYVKSGLALDGWADGIISGSRNIHLFITDASKGISVLEKPTGKIDASKGDVHPDGNPHYWLNPENGIVIAENIRQALTTIDPTGAEEYSKNNTAFAVKCKSSANQWKVLLAPWAGRCMLSYHSSWAYFADWLGIKVPMNIEPLPGIPPSGNHLAKLVAVIQKEKIKFVIQEPYFSDDAAHFLAKQTGLAIIKAAPSCDGTDMEAYLRHFDIIIKQISSVKE